MALQIHASSSLLTHRFLSYPPGPSLPRPNPTLVIRAQNGPTDAEPKKPTQPGMGFGPSAGPGKKKKKKGKREREREAVVRRSPVGQPAFVNSKKEEGRKEGERERAKELETYERAFVLGWLGLGGLIIAEGLALAASGFLPEEWDRLFVKYLFPVFTPTVFLFVAGSVGYGVFKYFQNENLKEQT